MIPKIKRIRRRKLQTGGTARKFENIPTASQPQQQKLGTRQEFADTFVSGQIKTPEVASTAQQTYTPQSVQTNELITGSTMTAPTDVAATSITAAPITAPTTGTSTQVATPTALTASQMTPSTGTAQTGTAQTGTVGTQSQVGTVTGTLSGTATGATAAPSTSAVVQAQQGQLSAGALAQVLTGTEATVAGQTATLPGNIQAAVANNPASITATIMNQPCLLYTSPSPRDRG